MIDVINKPNRMNETKPDISNDPPHEMKSNLGTPNPILREITPNKLKMVKTNAIVIPAPIAPLIPLLPATPIKNKVRKNVMKQPKDISPIPIIHQRAVIIVICHGRVFFGRSGYLFLKCFRY